ncbi:uncharacterized protein [Rutidosis leptorrhynchoides]|uniref:uncharacterized protein n=1 Tax=Rutidosis leptorrhynchoides TaxID=125765 RepID=UPI003A99D16C
MKKEISAPDVVANKMWRIVRILFYMLKSGISKSKLMVDLDLMMKKGNKLAGKAIENFLTCSNTPVKNFRRKNYHDNVRHFAKSHYRYDDAAKTVVAVQKMLEMLNNEVAVTTTSPLVFQGGRQLRITDSPFPLKDEGSDVMVDKKAEDFIKKFYKDLKMQKYSRAAFESPDPYMWAR